ncbi:MAG: antibiotic biosynthesis monooxygenase [Syntrophales bacterium]|nr:antibiotic biosynthesis monooxygenase [Syntrophales bacterium]
MVKVLIKRVLPRGLAPDKEGLLLGWITQLRSRASVQPGYISGETMMNVDNPDEYLVISTWESLNDWRAWFNSEERARIQKPIDELLGRETRYEYYYHPDKKRMISALEQVSPI